MAYIPSPSCFLARGTVRGLRWGLVPPPGYVFLRTQDGKLVKNQDGTYRVKKVS